MDMRAAVLIGVTCLVAVSGPAAADEPVVPVSGPMESTQENTSSSDSLEASSQSKLDLTLLGTVLPDVAEAMAIIQLGKTGEQALFRVDDVVGGGRVTRILRDRVVLTFADGEIELSLDGVALASSMPADQATATERVRPPLTKTEGGFWRVERESLDELSRGPERAAQVTSLGPGGVLVDNVQADDLFHKLGLKKGDVISSVNGQVPGADRSFQQAIAQTVAREEGILRLEVERQGLMDVLYYEITP